MLQIFGEDTLSKSAQGIHSRGTVGQSYDGHTPEMGDNDQCQGRLFLGAPVKRDGTRGTGDFHHCPP